MLKKGKSYGILVLLLLVGLCTMGAAPSPGEDAREEGLYRWSYTESVDTNVFFPQTNKVKAAVLITTNEISNVDKITANMSLYSISPSGTRTRIGYWPNEVQWGDEFDFGATKTAQRGYTYEFTGTAKVYVGTNYESVPIYDSNTY